MSICTHNTKSLQCLTLKKRDFIHFHAGFYVEADKQKQDSFILKYTTATIPVRHRASDQREPKQVTIKYFIPKKESRKNIPVCRTTFLRALGITKHRIQGVVKRHKITGAMPVERRGGDTRTKSYAQKLESVKKFIQKFKGTESHYCRSKTAVRIYLSSELNIKKMWRMYEKECEDPNLKVKESYFRHVFNTCFNIGFGTPQTDACSTCIELCERMKRETDLTKKNDLAVQKRVHNLKAKAFYSLLKENRDDLLILSFDCQKNQVMPKVPDQSAYYSRQLYKYNFTVVQGHSKSHLTSDNVFIYNWNETDFNKGSNEIASALYHRLTNTNFENKEVLRLVADGCGGQNKNSIIMTMLSIWMIMKSPKNLKEIEFVFPIVGHSFLPADRVFARIEKVIRSIEVVSSPTQYEQIFSDHGTCFYLGTDAVVYDWKSISQEVFKPPGQWHFQFAPAKRFFLKKNEKGNSILIRGEPNYKVSVGSYKGVTKRGKKLKGNRMEVIEGGVNINSLKLNDVDKLLKKHFGNEWNIMPDLTYFKNVLQQPADTTEQQNNDDCCQEADRMQEVNGIHV